MTLQDLATWAGRLKTTPKMPILFLGHGSPMNALSNNEFTKSWQTLGTSLPKPTAILSISAHWETLGMEVTAMKKPRTIYDFYNFPEKLYQMEYPAPGDPELAREICDLVDMTTLELDHAWGLDHGTWCVLKFLYPDADIPVLQLSLDKLRSPQYHYDLGRALSKLRERGVLIMGSGNIVHNLRMLDRNLPHEGFEWADEAKARMVEMIKMHDHRSLIDFENQGEAFRLAIPTDEHFLPLLYILGLETKEDEHFIFNDKSVTGSLAMTSVLIG